MTENSGGRVITVNSIQRDKLRFSATDVGEGGGCGFGIR